jgi:hypothetical protein
LSLVGSNRTADSMVGTTLPHSGTATGSVTADSILRSSSRSLASLGAI